MTCFAFTEAALYSRRAGGSLRARGVLGRSLCRVVTFAELPPDQEHWISHRQPGIRGKRGIPLRTRDEVCKTIVGTLRREAPRPRLEALVDAFLDGRRSCRATCSCSTNSRRSQLARCPGRDAARGGARDNRDGAPRLAVGLAKDLPEALLDQLLARSGIEPDRNRRRIRPAELELVRRLTPYRQPARVQRGMVTRALCRVPDYAA